MGVHQGLGNACESQAEIENAVLGRGVLEEPPSLAVPVFWSASSLTKQEGLLGSKAFDWKVLIRSSWTDFVRVKITFYLYVYFSRESPTTCIRFSERFIAAKELRITASGRRNFSDFIVLTRKSFWCFYGQEREHNKLKFQIIEK